jgi:hypothetical protein
LGFLLQWYGLLLGEVGFKNFHVPLELFAQENLKPLDSLGRDE